MMKIIDRVRSLKEDKSKNDITYIGASLKVTADL